MMSGLPAKHHSAMVPFHIALTGLENINNMNFLDDAYRQSVGSNYYKETVYTLSFGKVP